MNNVPSVSIGIAAYNEQTGIASVLRQILDQKRRGWTLKEVLVYCDGCTDRTEEKAKSVKGGRISIISSRMRRGKTFRLNQMFRRETGEILVMLDADIELSGRDVVTSLLAPFRTGDRVMLVGGNSRPLPPMTFFQKAAMCTFDVFDRSRQEILGGNNIFGCTGSVLAIRRDFAKSISFPSIVNEDAYLYLLCVQKGYAFAYNARAVVSYSLPKTPLDHIKQMLRSVPRSVETELRPYFGSLVHREFHRPLLFYLKALVSSFLNNPLGFVVVTLLNASIRPFIPLVWRWYRLDWFTAESTHGI